MSVPDWWASILLFLAAFRIWRLISKDIILDPIRSRLLGISSDWKEGDPVPATFREGLSEFVLCPWCLGFWITLAWWAAWQVDEHLALIAATPFALSTAVGMIAKLDQED